MYESLLNFPGSFLDDFERVRRSLESVSGFENVAAAFAAFRDRTVRPVLPRLVRTPGGVGLVVDDED